MTVRGPRAAVPCRRDRGAIAWLAGCALVVAMTAHAGAGPGAGAGAAAAAGAGPGAGPGAGAATVVSGEASATPAARRHAAEAARRGATASPGDEPALTFTADETRRILAHGPWPPPRQLDPGNAQSGRRAAIALGQLLFFEPRLASDDAFACATCHEPALAFADGHRRSLGRGLLDRNSPSLWNAVHERWYGWDGAADSLWSQSIRPILHPREMASSAAQVRQLLADDAELACRYRRVFGASPAAAPDDETVLVHAAKAIAAFVATLVSGRTRFDDFRDALARGDRRAMARYPVAAQRGLKLFVGRGRCTLCHAGPLFSNGEFGDTGLAHFVRPGEVDPGRHGGIAALRASPYNLLGRFNDAPTDGAAATKTRHLQPQHRNFGEFKVPSLRNVALTAPYGHDGQLADLRAVMQHYSELNLERLHADGERILEPLHLSEGESEDLIAFLQTLSDPRALDWSPPELGRCVAARR